MNHLVQMPRKLQYIGEQTPRLKSLSESTKKPKQLIVSKAGGVPPSRSLANAVGQAN